MADKPWAEIIDVLYENAGFGEYPKAGMAPALDASTDLSQQLDLQERSIHEEVTELSKRGLVKRNSVKPTGETERWQVELEIEGFTIAHDRDQARRNRSSNRAVTLLTLVLGFVGIAQATALTAQAAQLTTKFPAAMMGEVSVAVTTGAFFVLIIIYIALLKAGALTTSDLNP